MSFPSLVLDGDLNDKTITSMGLSYGDDTALYKPAYLTRVYYDVKRDAIKNNIGSGTPSRASDLSFNKMRMIHTFVGYLDVLTSSVSVTEFSSSQDLLNYALLASAAFLRISRGSGNLIVPHTVMIPDEVGPNKPSIDGDYEMGYVPGQTWRYKENPAGVDSTTAWPIMSTRITDNGNNTSRVTFNLRLIEPYFRTDDLIDNWS